MNRLRANLTPFLKAVTKALLGELEHGGIRTDVKKSIIDDIIQNLPAENSPSTSFYSNPQIVDTLHLELDGLLDLR